MTSCRTTFPTAASCSHRRASVQSRAILLDENKPQYAAQVEGDDQPAFNLHVMDADGTNINQISFNQAHDLDPAILNDGRVVFTRWEKAIDDSQMDLYSISPDGGDLQLLYGANSHDTDQADPTTGDQDHRAVPQSAADGGQPHAGHHSSVHGHR